MDTIPPSVTLVDFFVLDLPVLATIFIFEIPTFAMTSANESENIIRKSTMSKIAIYVSPIDCSRFDQLRKRTLMSKCMRTSLYGGHGVELVVSLQLCPRKTFSFLPKGRGTGSERWMDFGAGVRSTPLMIVMDIQHSLSSPLRSFLLWSSVSPFRYFFAFSFFS